MCGRYALSINHEDMLELLHDRYNIIDTNLEFDVPRYNIAPSQNVLAIIHDGQKYRAGPLKWGFIPSFAKDEQSSFNIINAKSETLTTKPMFKHAMQHKRCLILATSFYEWQKQDNKKLPILIKLKQNHIFSFAGLWTTFTKEDAKLHTCTIITTSANQILSSIHDRMPVILTPEQEKIWLDPNQSITTLMSLLKPYHNDMTYYPVSTIVNSPKNENQECINPL